MIDIQNLTKVFADGSARVVALEDVSLRVENGEVFGIIGNEKMQTMCEILDLLNLLFERELNGGLRSE